MSKIEQKERELIGKYVLKQLEGKDLSTKKILELNMFKDIYVNNKSKNEVMEKYNIARSTLYRTEKKFLEDYFKGASYIDVKPRNSKLTDEQNIKLKEALKGIPLSFGIPYLRWNIDRIHTYIKNNFGVEYSNTAYNKIFNKNIKYIDDDEIKEYVNKNYKCWYNIDMFYLYEKSNAKAIENKKKILKEEKGITYINNHKSKHVYAAIAIDANSNIYDASLSSTNFFIDNSMKHKLIDSLLGKLPIDDKILIIPMNEFFKLNELLELKERHKNIDFLIMDDKDEIKRIFRNDFEEKRENIEEQNDNKKVGINANHNKTIKKYIRNS